jgi:hypothetical protein
MRHILNSYIAIKINKAYPHKIVPVDDNSILHFCNISLLKFVREMFSHFGSSEKLEDQRLTKRVIETMKK